MFQTKFDLDNPYYDDDYDMEYDENHDYHELGNQKVNCCFRIKNIWKSCIYRLCLFCNCRKEPSDISISEEEGDLL